MSKYKLPRGQKLIKEVGNFLLIQQYHFHYSGTVTNDLWFKYYIHKNALNNAGNYGVINFRDKSTYSVIDKDFKIQTYNNLEDAFKFVEELWS